MKCVQTTEIYSAQEFVEALTGYYYVFMKENTVDEVRYLLNSHGIKTNDYPLDKIEEVVSNGEPVVLVEFPHVDMYGGIHNEYRWFEVPDDINIFI